MNALQGELVNPALLTIAAIFVAVWLTFKLVTWLLTRLWEWLLSDLEAADLGDWYNPETTNHPEKD